MLNGNLVMGPGYTKAGRPFQGTGAITVQATQQRFDIDGEHFSPPDLS
jgi:hypothetical protein